MNADIDMMHEIAAELQVQGMTRLPQLIVRLAMRLEDTIEQTRDYALAESAAICTGYANDFAGRQFDSLYAAGRTDQALACAQTIRKLAHEGDARRPLRHRPQDQKLLTQAD